MQEPILYPESLVWIAALVSFSLGYLTRSIKARFERIARERDAIREHRARNLMLRSLAERAASFDPAKETTK